MKTNKLLAAGALALSMAMTPVASLINSMPIMADEVAQSGTISVKEGDTHTYSVYQIFTGTLGANNSLSNIKWGSNAAASYSQGENVPDSVIEELLNNSSSTDKEKLNVIEKYVNLTGTAYGTVSASSSLTNVPAGYYLIKESGKVTGTDAATLFITKVVGNVTIDPKKDVPKLEKKVQDTNDTTGVTSAWIDSADYDFGDQVPFQLTASLPSNYGDYSTYKLVFTDTYDTSAFEYVTNSLTVKSGDNDITQYADISTNTAGKIVVTIDDLKTVDTTATSSTKVVVSYKATLKTTAALGKTQNNQNTAYLEFSNNPNTSGDGDMGKTPEDTVRVFTFEVDVTKTDNENNALNGAGFTLFKKMKNPDPNGQPIETQIGQEIKPQAGNKFEFKGLDDGDYVLKETTVPSGYTKAADLEFTITATHDGNSANPQLTKIEISNNKFAVEDNTGLITTTVVNSREGNLPETGGMGTTMIYGVGAVMVAGAAVFYVTNKRTRKD